MRGWQYGALFAALVLAGCQDSGERAQSHFESAMALLEDGDFARAQVEFRNVFQLDGTHREARSAYANALRARDELDDAYGQYLRLVEQFPDDVEGRIALAEMAISFGNSEEAERHGSRAMELAPDDPRIAVIALNLRYTEALRAQDELAREAVADEARALSDGNSLILWLLIDDALRAEDNAAALTLVDEALTLDADNRLLHDLRLSVLVDQNEVDALEVQLRDMIARFPEDDELVATLLRFYLQLEGVEAGADFLRETADTSTDTDRRDQALIALVQLRMELNGPEAALEELERISATLDDAPLDIALMRASVMMADGRAADAMADLEALLETELPPGDEAEIRVLLGRILEVEANLVGARAQIEQALELDGGNVAGLKTRARWLISEDEADQAIGLLRIAIDNSTGDVEALTLMAEAHARNGDRDLGREFLLLAVEASNSAPEPTMRYADQLMSDGSFLVAEEALITALRLAPNQPDILRMLGQIYVQTEDWPRLEQIEATLREIGDPDLDLSADGLRAARLAAQGNLEGALATIEALASESGVGNVRTQLAVVQARLSSGDIDGALAFTQELVAEAPDQVAYQLLLANVQLTAGQFDDAEAGLRALLEVEPSRQAVWLTLLRLLNGQERTDEAAAVLEDGLAVLPDALDLLWAQASLREQSGDIDGAIETYEAMYARVPDATVVANNLASLLATYRDDDESLERAWSVARRLRGLEVPAFQDTYGWIAYRRGDYQSALEHLEPAAAGLAEDAVVQFHLGMTYLALERSEDALVQLRQAVELAGPDDMRPQFEIARGHIAELEAAQE